MKNNIILFITLLVMFGILSVLIIMVPGKVMKGAAPSSAWTDEDQMNYANMLAAKGLTSEAALALEKYIDNSSADRKEIAKVCYRLGDIYMKLYEYKKALKSFYRAEMLDPDGDFINEMNRKIVEALENAGMSTQAQYELEARSSLKKSEQKTGKIIARIGKDEISEQEINRAIDRLPEWLRKQVQTDKERQNFIREYVAKEVLYKKAKRLGLDRTPEAKEIIEELKKQYALQQLVQREMEKNVKITPDDLKLYYEANKDKYVAKTGEEGKEKKRQMSFEEVKSRVEREYMLRKQAEVTDSLLKEALEAQEVKIYSDIDKKENAEER